MATERRINEAQTSILDALDKAIKEEGKVFLTFENLRSYLATSMAERPGNRILTQAIDRLVGKQLVVSAEISKNRYLYYSNELIKAYLDKHPKKP